MIPLQLSTAIKLYIRKPVAPQRTRWVIVALASLSSSACLPIPHRHIKQPGGTFRVTDQGGRPVAGAAISVYEGSIIGSRVRRLATDTTDATGAVAIRTKRNWHWFVLLVPDAEAPSLFGWCAEAAGYAALGRTMEGASDTIIVAPLLPSRTPSHCPAVLDQIELEQGRIRALAV